ncbi:MAG: hypothetical protein ACTH1D_10555 [Mycobacteriaceae bacterium]|uniref:hypothetical protein n=1 Tax=Corynebacterium sp. TaxID=1720 RepID=UPI003F99D81A
MPLSNPPGQIEPMSPVYVPEETPPPRRPLRDRVTLWLQTPLIALLVLVLWNDLLDPFPFWQQAIIIVVAILIVSELVYRLVALVVRMSGATT